MKEKLQKIYKWVLRKVFAPAYKLGFDEGYRDMEETASGIISNAYESGGAEGFRDGYYAGRGR